MCCIPETNETNFEKNSCNDTEKIATVGSGGQQATFSTFFYPKKFVIVLILKNFSVKVKLIFMLFKTPKELILLNNAFHNEQKLQDEIVSFAIFSQTFTKCDFFRKPLVVFCTFSYVCKA